MNIRSLQKILGHTDLNTTVIYLDLVAEDIIVDYQKVEWQQYWGTRFSFEFTSKKLMFSPVDTAYWISRNMFYPALIYINPGMQETKFWQGSESTTKGLGKTRISIGNSEIGLANLGIGNRFSPPYGKTLKITKPNQEEKFQYPVLQTYNVYQYKFNEKASKYWDFKYERADGHTPFEEEVAGSD